LIKETELNLHKGRDVRDWQGNWWDLKLQVAARS